MLSFVKQGVHFPAVGRKDIYGKHQSATAEFVVVACGFTHTRRCVGLNPDANFTNSAEADSHFNPFHELASYPLNANAP